MPFGTDIGLSILYFCFVEEIPRPAQLGDHGHDPTQPNVERIDAELKHLAQRAGAILVTDGNVDHLSMWLSS